MKLNGRSVVVGGAKPRSLIVTSGDIVPRPGTWHGTLPVARGRGPRSSSPGASSCAASAPT